jgi:hypothetical protein
LHQTQRKHLPKSPQLQMHCWRQQPRSSQSAKFHRKSSWAESHRVSPNQTPARFNSWGPWGPFEQPFIALSNTFRDAPRQSTRGDYSKADSKRITVVPGGTRWHHGEKKELHGIGRAQSLLRPGKKAAHRTQARCPSKVRMPQIREMKLGSLKSWMSYLNPLH